MAKSKLTNKAVEQAINDHHGKVRFGTFIIARKDEGGNIEARFLQHNNIWSDWMRTDAETIGTECRREGVDAGMIVLQ